MQFSKGIRLITLFIFGFLINTVSAGEGKVSGLMFGDFYYNFSNPDTSVNYNGFQLRRVYFNYDRDISETFSVRFRLEMNSSPGAQLEPYIKNAYLAWKNLIPNSTLYFGAQGTPTFSVAEKVWGYRAVEKTIMDLRGVSGSSDLGIGISGKLNESGSFGYHVLVANGEGKKGESNEYKKVFVSIPVVVADHFNIVPYVDYEGAANDMTKQTLALFIGMTGETLNAGVEVFQKTDAKAMAGKDLVKSGFSIFGSARVAEKLKGFARLDMYDPNTDVDNDGNNFIIAGLDYEVEKDVNVIPNIRIESYELSAKDNLVTGMLTFFYKF
jgi:hypothetical protein